MKVSLSFIDTVIFANIVDSKSIVDSLKELVIELSWHVLRFSSKELVSVFAGT